MSCAQLNTGPSIALASEAWVGIGAGIGAGIG
jgi:hypothetical protein